MSTPAKKTPAKKKPASTAKKPAAKKVAAPKATASTSASAAPQQFAKTETLVEAMKTVPAAKKKSFLARLFGR